MNGELRLMFLSEFWMPCSHILLWFKKDATFVILVLELLLFYETHITAFRGQHRAPSGSAATFSTRDRGQNLVVGSEQQASWLGRVVRK